MNITLKPAEKRDASKLALLSKKAFDSDAEVGAPGPGGPPGYDSSSFQKRVMDYMDYYVILLGDTSIGGIFVGYKNKFHKILERIFVDPDYHNQGVATQAMAKLWEKYPDVQLWTLGTPEWNVRTRYFYEKLGFKQVGWEVGPFNWRGIWYQKEMDPSSPYIMQKIVDLKDGMKNITVEGKIRSISSVREVISRSTGEPLKVTSAELADPSSEIDLVLWNEQISQIKIGDLVRVEFGYIKNYQGRPQLNVGWSGKLILLNRSSIGLNISLRSGTSADQDFLYYLKKTTLKEYVARVWGWDEDYQLTRHRQTVDPESYHIIQLSGEDIGCIETKIKPNTIFLSVIEILPQFQNQGIGKTLIREIIEQGQQESKNIELQVLKVNKRALQFYQKLGFVISNETEAHYQMVYSV
jgi:ribosomal protein S18 acetylase RimI-like enzyme